MHEIRCKLSDDIIEKLEPLQSINDKLHCLFEIDETYSILDETYSILDDLVCSDLVSFTDNELIIIKNYEEDNSVYLDENDDIIHHHYYYSNPLLPLLSNRLLLKSTIKILE